MENASGRKADSRRSPSSGGVMGLIPRTGVLHRARVAIVEQPGTPEGVEMPQTVLDDDYAADLADIATHLGDLQRVLQLCGPLQQPEQLESIVASALWEAAVITYGRCFTSGKSAVGKRSRRKIPQSVLDQLSTAATAAHTTVMDWRNRHVGHRVGDTTGVRVLAHHNPWTGRPEMVSHFTVSLVLPDAHVVLPPLAQELIDHLLPLQQAEGEALLERTQRVWDDEHGPGSQLEGRSELQ